MTKSRKLNDDDLSTQTEKEATLRSTLSERRKLLNVTLEELSQKTGVQTKYLRRIEEGSWGLLPSRVYTRGFLKKYARIVGLNVDDVIRRYEQEVSRVEKTDSKDDKENRGFVLNKFLPKGGISPKIVKVGLVLIVLVFILGYIGWQLSIVLVNPNITVGSPQENEVVIFRDNITIKGSVDNQSDLFLNDRLMDTDVDGKFEENIELLPGLNILELKAASRFGKETIIIKRIIFETN